MSSLDILPVSPSARKVVFVLREEDVDRCSYEEEAGNIFSDGQVSVLPYPWESENANSTASQNIIQIDPHPGAILIRNPYNFDLYTYADTARDDFAKEKYNIFIELCRRLGASSLKIEETKIISEDKSQQASIKGNSVARGAQAEIETNTLNRFREFFSKEIKFSGGEADIDGALKHIRKNNLSNDSDFVSLINLRDGGNNKIKSYASTISLLKETNGSLKVAAGIEIPAFLKIDAEYKKIVNATFELNVNVAIEF